MIAVIGGARETATVCGWLAHAGAGVMLIEGADSEHGETRDAKRDADHGAAGVMCAMRQDVSEAVAIVDVSHAFDEATRAAVVARAPGLPYARVRRAPWVPAPTDRWTQTDTLAEAVAALPARARVFAATGRGSLPALARHDGPVFLRQLTRHDLPMPLPEGAFVFGTAPFSVADEVTLLRGLEIDVVLARNIGGAGSFPKLAAARKLGLPVVLLRPPAVPDGPRLASYRDVKAWIATL